MATQVYLYSGREPSELEAPAPVYGGVKRSAALSSFGAAAVSHVEWR